MSTLKVDTLTDTGDVASVPIEDVINGSARAWVNFNGSGTVSVTTSYNVTSITDLGTGQYRVTLTNAMTDANYACFATAGQFGANIAVAPWSSNSAPTTTTFALSVINYAGTYTDNAIISAAIFR